MIEWYPEAVQSFGPSSKMGGYAAGNFSPKRGEIKHSMVGGFLGAMSVLQGSTRSSWHFSVLRDGRVFQHYPLSANCWHGNDSDDDGGVRANIDLVGVEHEGGAPGNESEPLTPAQLEASIKLTAWMAEQCDFTRYARFPGDGFGAWLLCEHNEVGNTPTACPSGRIPWGEILRRLEVPVADKPTEEELRLGVIETIISGKYRPEYIGPNALGERVIELKNADGTQASPPIIMATLGPGQKR